MKNIFKRFTIRFDGADNWSSDINGNCILSTFEVDPSDQRKVIANDKDWDLYNYDRSSQTCGNRNFSPNLSTKRGNEIVKKQIFIKGNDYSENLMTIMELQDISKMNYHFNFIRIKHLYVIY